MADGRLAARASGVRTTGRRRRSSSKLCFIFAQRGLENIAANRLLGRSVHPNLKPYETYLVPLAPPTNPSGEVDTKRPAPSALASSCKAARSSASLASSRAIALVCQYCVTTAARQHTLSTVYPRRRQRNRRSRPTSRSHCNGAKLCCTTLETLIIDVHSSLAFVVIPSIYGFDIGDKPGVQRSTACSGKVARLGYLSLADDEHDFMRQPERIHV